MSDRYKNVTAGKCFISVEDKIYTTESFALVFSIWYYRIKKYFNCMVYGIIQ